MKEDFFSIILSSPRWAVACLLLGFGGVAFPAFLIPAFSSWIPWIRAGCVVLILSGIGGIGHARYRQGHKAQAVQIWAAMGIVFLLVSLLYVWFLLLLETSP